MKNVVPCMLLTAALLLGVESAPAQQHLMTEGAHYAMSQEPPIYLRADGYDYDHEILVALPATYQAQPDKLYPVLWAMDGALLFDLTVGLVNFYSAGNRFPEMIVVGVGHRREEGMAGLMKRTADLFPPGSQLTDEGAAADYMREVQAEFGLDPDADPFEGVQGDMFLDFLIDDVRSALAQKYRMADDHTLFGHSAGGAFTGYALFARPGAFSRYIIGSGTNGLTITLEQEFARQQDDLDAKVFIGAGDLEANNLGMAAQRIVSRTILFGENLLLREYPSLRLQTRVYRDRDHYTVLPLIIGDGLKFVFAEEAAQLPKPRW